VEFYEVFEFWRALDTGCFGVPRLCASLSVLAAFSLRRTGRYEGREVSILWIILVVVVVLALLGYFGRGRRRAL
jgi:hypothetical protein